VKPHKHVVNRPRAVCVLRPGGGQYRGQEQGLALVLTLFVVALVTVLVLEYHFDASVEIDLAMNYASDVQAYHLALAGVRFAQALLERDSPKVDGPDDSWYKLGLVPACFSPQQLLELATAGLGEGLPTDGRDAKTALSQRVADQRLEDISQGGAGCVSLRITDEDSKLPINDLRPPSGDGNQQPDQTWPSIFQKFFDSFKIDHEVVDALIEWLDTGDNPRGTSNAGKAYYQSLPIPYAPRNGPMRTPGEIRLVKGLDNVETLAKLFPGATPEAVADLDFGSNSYLTPFGAEQKQVPGKPAPKVKVNVNTASPEVLRALIAGAQPAGSNSNLDGVVEDIVGKRQEKQLTKLSDAVPANLLKDLDKVADVKSNYFRIESTGVVGIVQKKIVAVLKRDSRPANSTNPAKPMTPLYFKVE
jgi:type II secretory pathway component PulK